MMDWSLVPLVLVFGAMVAISVVLFRMRSNAEKESADEDAMRRAVEIAAARATQERSNPRRAQTASRMRRRAPGVAAASSSSSGGASQLDGAAAGDDGEDVAGAAPPGRISKKKELNKEAKRAAKAAREAAIEAQRERDAARAERAAEKEEEERRLEQEAETRQKKEEEERAKKEQEEYDQWKNLISVENTGDQEEELATESQGLLAEFVEFIKQEKVVVLEELAARFNLRTEDAVNRVQSLEAMGHVSGVFDDRGKFIYVSRENMEALATFIRKEGRVTLRNVIDEASALILPQTQTNAAA